MVKRILSFALCVIMIFGIGAVPVSAVYNVKQLFTVQANEVKNGKISYTVNVTANQSNIGGIAMYVEYDSSVLAISKAKPSTTTTTSTGETQNFKGNFVHGNKENDPNVYTIAYINTVAVSTGSVAKAFFDIEFNVIDPSRPLTDVKFYCKEYYSTSESDKNITVSDGPQLFGDFTNTKTMEVPKMSAVVPYNDGLKVTWEPVEGATYYKVYRIIPYDPNGWTALPDGEIEVNKDTALEYYDTNLVSGTNYTYAVSAINYYETEYDKKGVSCIYVAKPEIAEVKNVVGGIEVSWNETDGAAFYNIMRRVAGETEWTKLASRAASLDEKYKDTNVEEGVTYEYDIISATDTFQSISAEKGEKITYIPAPQVISIQNTLQGVVLTWNTVLNANRYTVYRWENGVDTGFLPYDTVSDTSYTDSSVESGNTYAYTVKAHTDYGESGYSSNGYSIIRVPSTEVTSLTLGKASVNIKWNAVEDINGYTIYRKEENTSNWVKIGSVGSDVTEFSDSTALSGYYYNYAVCPVVRSSEGPKISSDEIFFISAPGNVIAENVKEGINVTWDTVGGAISYEVMRLDVYGEFNVIGIVSKDDKAEFLDTEDIETDKTYVYCVRAVNPLGNSLDSDISNELRRITAIGKTTPQLYEGGVKVTWEPSSKAEKYAIYRTEGEKWAFLGTSTEPEYVDTSVVSDLTYSYAVAVIIGESRGVLNTEEPKTIRYIAPPKNVEATSGDKSLVITWDSVSGATEYSIYKTNADSEGYSLIGKVGSETFSFTDYKVIPGVAYKYVVSATGAELTSLNSQPVIAEFLETPVITKRSNEYDGAQITWKKVQGAYEYVIYSKTKTTGWKVIDIVGSNISTYVDPYAINGERMYYTVRARSQHGMSGFKTYAIDYLTAPTLSFSNTKTGTKITWKENSKAEYYYVYRKTNSAKSWTRIATTPKATYEDKKAAEGVTYSYTIKAVHEPYTSGYHKTGWKYRFLKTPTQSSVSNAYGSVVVKWNKIKGATGYIVYRKVDGAKNWTRLGTVKTTSYTDKAVVNRSNYRYAVKAYYGSSTSSYNNGKINKYIQAPKLTVTNALSGVQLKWTKIGGASSYYIYRKAGSAKSWTKIATVTRNSYTDLNVKTGVKYTYTIKAYGSKALSGYYTKGWAIVFLNAPKISSAVSKSNGINLKWNKISGADGYMVYHKIGDGNWVYLGKTSSGSKVTFVDKKAKKGYTYTYAVRACRGSSRSAYYSNVKCKDKY